MVRESVRALAAVLAVTAVAVQDPALDRARKLVAQMTLDEKLGFVQGNHTTMGYTGRVVGVPRLGVPDLLMNDGPQGFRGPPGTSTQWPSGLTLARSFDRDLFREMGEALGAEFYGKGANVAFGPGLNVARLANGGRSFEYLSGEDPYLGWSLVQPIVQGMQSKGVMATVKHYLDNNQEGLNGAGDRHATSENVDERTQMELYFPPFAGAVEAGALAVMCANNLVNGQYVCQNAMVENTMLKKWAGFKGWVCSDYDGTRSAVEAANNGLDIAMPGPPSRPDYFGSLLREQIAAGNVTEATITDKAVRAVYSLAAVGALDKPNNNTPDTNVTSDANRALARKLAAASAVLLKNQGGILPIDPKATIAVIGTAGNDGSIFGGSGSGKVIPIASPSLWDALRERGGTCGGADGKCVYNDGKNADEAAKAAQSADIAIVVLSATSSEGKDRTTLELDQESIVEKVAAANPNTIVVTITPGPFLTHWKESARAILDLGFPGERAGPAAWDVLYGAVSPRGKLPHSLPKKENEQGFTERQYPGVPPNTSTGLPLCDFKPVASAFWTKCAPYEAYYSEKLENGYRWYDKNNVKPSYPFGHGLSYASFQYSALETSDAERTVGFTVKNTGSVQATEVPQLYLRYPDAAQEPFIQLRGFQAVPLAPGAETKVTFKLDDRWVSVWNEDQDKYEVVSGDFQVLVGSSSADIRLQGKLKTSV